MDSSDDSPLDDLVARRTVQDFDRFRYVLLTTRNCSKPCQHLSLGKHR